MNAPLAVSFRLSLPLSVSVMLLPEASPLSVPPTVYVVAAGGGGVEPPPPPLLPPHAVRREEIEIVRIVHRVDEATRAFLKAGCEIDKIATPEDPIRNLEQFDLSRRIHHELQ